VRTMLSAIRTRAVVARAPASGISSCVAYSSRRCYAKAPGRFTNTKKSRVEVLEREAEYPPQQSYQQQHGYGQGGFQSSQSQPSTVFPSYVDDHERRKREQQGTQWDNLSSGVVEHMRKVYGTLAAGIGIAAGASVFAMATPLGTVSPFVPGLLSLVPLMGLMYTNKHTHSLALRTGLYGAFAGLAGWSLAPLLKVALAVSPMAVPQALLITTGLFGTMTALSMLAKPGSALRLGVPLGAGMIMLMLTGVAGMFVPVTSAWYPLLHNFYLYGGLGIFTLYIAYDTQRMIDDYEMGEDDHLKHALDLFINFKAIFVRVLALLMGRSDD